MSYLVRNRKTGQYVVWYNEYGGYEEARRFYSTKSIVKATEGHGILASFYTDEADLDIVQDEGFSI